MSELRYLENVVSLDLDREACIGCGMCLTVCPRGVFRLTDGKAEYADRDACIECGGCAQNCPVEAIAVKPGAGCATLILNGWLGRSAKDCC